LSSLAYPVFPNSVRVTVCHRLISDDETRPFLDQLHSDFITQSHCKKKGRNSIFRNTTDIDFQQRKSHFCWSPTWYTKFLFIYI